MIWLHIRFKPSPLGVVSPVNEDKSRVQIVAVHYHIVASATRCANVVCLGT